MQDYHEILKHRLHHSRSNISLCALGGQYGDIGWFSLQFLITILNISAISANIFFIIVCGRAGVMHRNMRLMLSTISACFTVNATAGLLYNIYFFYLGIGGFPLVAKQSAWCSVINTLMVPWDAATCLLMVGVGAERLIATKRQMPSAAISNYVKVIFLLAWSAAIFVTVNYVMNLTNQGVCICDGASLSDRYAMLLRISICAMVEAGTISLFGYVLILSRSEADGLGINTAKYSLSKRFQIYETYRTTQMLLPSAVLHAVMYLSYLCLLIPVRDLRCHALSYIVTFNVYDTFLMCLDFFLFFLLLASNNAYFRAERTLTVTQFNLSTIIFAFPSIHGLAHPLICLCRHFYLRQRVDDFVSSIFPRAPPIVLEASTPEERGRLQATPELSSSQSFRSEHDRRIEFRIAPERHAEILESFWERK